MHSMYIGGKWIKTKESSAVVNPATEEIIAQVPKATEKHVDKAVAAARKAFDHDWKYTTPAERAGFLWKLADLIERDALKLAKLESQNTGKTVRYARDSDLLLTIDNLRYFAGAGRSLDGSSFGEYANFLQGGRRTPLGSSMIRREPVGVVAAVVPWNYPLMIAAWKIGPALAAGNTMVLKPASITPLSLLAIAKLAEEAGIPPGVLNVVTGSGAVVGNGLASHSGVDMICLTGNVETGKTIMERATSNMKRLHLELGGKAPQLILDDADLEAAARGAAAGAFWNVGQDCTAITRVYVPEKKHDRFLSLLIQELKKFVIGDPSKESTDLGPLVSKEHRESVERFIESGKKKTKLVYGGRRVGTKGFFLEPTVFTEVPHHHDLCQKEIFGPVLTVFPYKKLAEAMTKANDVRYALAASVWGRDITTLVRVANALDFGTVWINEHGVLVSEMPHGGFKLSGFGKDLSHYSLEEFQRIKHIYIDQTGMAKKPWHPVIYRKA